MFKNLLRRIGLLKAKLEDEDVKLEIERTDDPNIVLINGRIRVLTVNPKALRYLMGAGMQ